MKYEERDITLVDRGIVAHQVNCQGKMNSGVAKAIRLQWPVVYDIYQKQGTGSEMLGSCHFITIEEDVLYVANIYGQDKYGYDGKQYTCPDALRKGLDSAFRGAQHFNLPLYLPKIASKRGGMKWEEVTAIIEDLNNTYDDVEVTICEYEE